MTITQSHLEDIDESFGTGTVDASASGNDAPNGHNMIGAVNAINRVASDMDEYSIAYSDLPPEKQTTLDEAVEDLRYHLKKMANVFGADLVGKDDAIELPNGNTVSLPGSATSGSGNSTDLPSDPRA